MLQDGTRVAVVQRLGAGYGSEERVSVSIKDLKPGDLVVVQDVGRSWDQPQWWPTAALMGRVGAQ